MYITPRYRPLTQVKKILRAASQLASHATLNTSLIPVQRAAANQPVAVLGW